LRAENASRVVKYAFDNPLVFVDPTGEQSEGLGEAARREKERRQRLTEAGQTATVRGTNLGEGEGSRAGQPKPSNLLELPPEVQREIDEGLAEARRRREREPQIVVEEEEPSLIEKGLAIVGYIPSKGGELAEEEAGKRFRSALVKPKQVDPDEEKELQAIQETLGVTREQAEHLRGPYKKAPESLAEHGAYGAGIAVQAGAEYVQGRAVGRALESADDLRASRGASRTKPVNLPAWRRVTIDMEEVTSGHMQGGSRLMPGSRKDLFPNHMNAQQVERAIRDAYRHAERVRTQGERVLIRGTSPKTGLRIEMWVNTQTNTIDTAYPTLR